MTTETPLPSLLHPLPRRIIRNTLYTTAGNWITLGIAFFLVPYIVNHIGVEVYGGVWVVGALVIAYAQILDFGIGSSCIKFIAEHAARGEESSIRRVVSTGMAFYGALAALLLLGMTAFGRPILALIGVPTPMLGDALFVVSGALAIMILMNTLAPMTSALPALQRMDISNTILVVTNLLGIVQTVIILGLGGGVRGLILGNLAVQVFSAGVSTYWARRLLPSIVPRASSVHWPTLKRLWSYGINLQISRASQIVVFQTDRLATLRFLGTQSAAFYDISVKVAMLARNVPLVFTPALLPATSDLDSRNERQKIAFLFERGSRYLILAGTPLLGFVFLESRLVVSTWMGRSLGDDGIVLAARIVKILLAGYYLNMVTGVASTIAAGIGRTDLERRAGILALVLTPLLIAALMTMVGPLGIPLSTSLVLAVVAVYYMFMFCRILRASLRTIRQFFLKPFGALLLAIAVTRVIQSHLLPPEEPGRLAGVLLLLCLFLLFAVCYLGGLLLLRMPDSYDRVILNTLLEKIRTARSARNADRR